VWPTFALWIEQAVSVDDAVIRIFQKRKIDLSPDYS